VIHIFFGVPTGLICRMCGTGRVPYIVSMRGSDVPGTSVSFKLEHRILSKALTWIWRNAAALVACSEGLKERALSNDASLKIDVITNGVDLDKFRPGPGRKQGVWRLGTVGRLTDSKRYNVLIGTVERLSNDGHMVELAIAGTGKLDGELRGLVKERGLEAVVKFHGRIEAEKMPEFYKKIDVFVSATAAEGMSNAMLEAMASGLPIVTTQCEGLRELIVDNGIIVEEGVDDFAAAVQSLLGDQEKYAAMCAAARRQAEQFTWHRAAEHYAGIYKRIAERRDKGL
jgi:glycosyltransferase involved in cell wall biosynthesis